MVTPLILPHAMVSAALSTSETEKWETIHCSPGSHPPADLDLIRPESLGARCLRQRCDCAHAIAEQPSLRDHDSVVDAEPFFCCEDTPASLCGHDTIISCIRSLPDRVQNQSRLSSETGLDILTSHTANDQYFFTSDVRRGAFCDLH